MSTLAGLRDQMLDDVIAEQQQKQMQHTRQEARGVLPWWVAALGSCATAVAIICVRRCRRSTRDGGESKPTGHVQ